jgi:hypothetical protein
MHFPEETIIVTGFVYDVGSDIEEGLEGGAGGEEEEGGGVVVVRRGGGGGVVVRRGGGGGGGERTLEVHGVWGRDHSPANQRMIFPTMARQWRPAAFTRRQLQFAKIPSVDASMQLRQ